MLKFLFSCIFGHAKISPHQEQTIQRIYSPLTKMHREEDVTISCSSSPGKEMQEIVKQWFIFAANGNVDSLREIKDQIGNINIRDDFGNTALHIAAKNLNKNTIEYLLQEGCIKGLRNNHNQTARDVVVSDNTELGEVDFRENYFKIVTVLALLPYERNISVLLIGELESFDDHS